jgi:hypothetical protein
VSDDVPDYNAISIDPNIEHAYVYFMEDELHTTLTD